MTEKMPFKSRKSTTAALCLLVLFFLLLLLKNPSIATESVKNALSLCAHVLLPALFPFMVLAELLIACGFGDFFGKRFGCPIASLFGISRESSAVILFGLLCGFPVGARMALALYDKGRISKSECERLLGLSGLPSIAFLVSAVGGSLYRSQRFGILLWLSCMLSAILVGILTRKKGASVSEAHLSFVPPPFARAFTSAIANATTATLSICAYVLFFGTILNCLSHALSAFPLPNAIRALLYGLFEISSGVNAAASLGSLPLSALLCALTVGWSGLSIHCQLLTLSDGRDLSFRFYFRAKAIEAILCALITVIWAPFCF